ncbi:hypothetical protein QYE76_049767 [Lolium multiflorum]|uniref:Pentatricopeptide repeat-containing protein n=1 Tax=Lolium multiflorum TaxID=4521 RepID=A0AAD8SNN6_LOLMU|nr:hypothetical protein QYE76_049765 [Lolium multiflorum]KAK1661607.1 hypothetical protein QYE76_049766 [Lolium multiflorum]KAK1661608.1 hypothetical protein QYE76_049767 [Lolium multiflorum]
MPPPDILRVLCAAAVKSLFQLHAHFPSATRSLSLPPRRAPPPELADWLLHALAQSGRTDDAVRVFNHMRAVGLFPTPTPALRSLGPGWRPPRARCSTIWRAPGLREHLTAGKLAAASDTLNEMAKNTLNKFWFMPSKRA